MPQKNAGPRIDPPVSDPMATRVRAAATAAPDPDDEPPVKQSRFQGLRAGGNGKSKLGPPNANSCVASLPSSTAPPALSFASTTQSSVGTWSIRSFEWQVVRMPAVA